MPVERINPGRRADFAIIVSGDQDYVPAVQAVKNYGKKTYKCEALSAFGGRPGS